MAVTYLLSVTIALFTGALPAQILGIIWEPVSEGMSAEIPYIALLRLLGGAGAIAAVILSDRIRGYIMARDLIVGAIALEALSLIGFSMSREFWNLGVWITAIGFSGALSLSLICYLLRATYSRRTSLLFVSSALGIACGVYVVRYILSLGRSWRTACQGLAIVQIILCMVIFLLRRTILKDVAGILRERRKEAGIERQRRREQLVREKGDVDERASNVYLVRLLFLYGAVLCCGVLLLSAVHLTYIAQAVEQEGNADLSVSILTVCLGMAAGRALAWALKQDAGRIRMAGSVLCLLCLGFCTAASWMNHAGAGIVFLSRFGTGCGAGMIFPCVIQMEDERFDDEAQTTMTGLIPAFYLGADCLITPFAQSMAGDSRIRICMTAMFALACFMGGFLAFACVKLKRGKG